MNRPLSKQYHNAGKQYPVELSHAMPIKEDSGLNLYFGFLQCKLWFQGTLARRTAETLIFCQTGPSVHDRQYKRHHEPKRPITH